MVKYSIVLTAKDGFDLTKNCIDSIREHSSDYEIILVADVTSMEIAKKYRGFEGSDITLKINEGKSMGAVKSYNLGFSMIKGDFLVFLNNDTTVAKDWLGIMSGYCEKFDAIVGLAGENLIITDDDIKCEGYVGNDGKDIWIDADKLPKFVDYVGGGCFIMSRKIFEAVGYFDENIKYAHDVDYCLRAKAKGYRSMVVCVPGYCHYVSITFKQAMSGDALREKVDESLKCIALKIKNA